MAASLSSLACSALSKFAADPAGRWRSLWGATANLATAPSSLPPSFFAYTPSHSASPSRGGAIKKSDAFGAGARLLPDLGAATQAKPAFGGTPSGA